jgi:hypothetical protein
MIDKERNGGEMMGEQNASFPRAAIYVALGCAVLGGAMATKGFLDYEQDCAVEESWSRVEAVVTKLETRDEEVTTQKWRTVVSFHYEYVLNDVTQQGNEEWFADSSAEILELSQRYAEGTTHHVWTNPAKPSESRILAPEPGGSLALAVLGCVIFIGGFLWPAVEWRRRRPARL